jgi:hypothetical protein
VDNKEALEDLFCVLGVFLVLLHGVLFEVILLHSTFVFLAFNILTWRPKQSAWEGLVVVLLLVLWLFLLKFGKYFASCLDALTSLLYCVARIYSFAGHQRLGGVNFRFGNSLIQPSKASVIFLLSFPAFPLTFKHLFCLKLSSKFHFHVQNFTL